MDRNLHGRVASTEEPTQFQRHYRADLGKRFDISIYSPNKGQFATLVVDVTERKAAETVP